MQSQSESCSKSWMAKYGRFVLVSCNILALFWLASAAVPVKAACGSKAVKVWKLNPFTGQINPLGNGYKTECGNIHGAMENVDLSRFRIGWSKCSSQCAAGKQPGLTYVTINGQQSSGSAVFLKGRATCIADSQYPVLYCWQ